MKNITEFISLLESGKHYFNIWVYSNKGHYCPFVTRSNMLRTSSLQEAIKNHLQIIVEINKNEIDNAFLLLPEVHMVVPIIFHGDKVLSITGCVTNWGAEL